MGKKGFFIAAYGVLSFVGYYIGFFGVVIFQQLYRAGFIDFPSLLLTTIGFGACAVSIFSLKALLEKKVTKETYLFTFLVPAFSIAIHAIANIIFGVGFSFELIVVISVIVATPLSCYLAGYSHRTLRNKIRHLGLDQGITFATLVILTSIPIIQFAPKFIEILSVGTINYPPIIFQEGNDTARLNCTMTKYLFTVEIPLISNTEILAERMANITNQVGEELNVSVLFEGFHGNISETRELQIVFTLDDGSKFYPLNLNSSMMDFETHASFKIGARSSVNVGLILSVGDISFGRNQSVYCQMQLETTTLSIHMTTR